MQRRRWSFLLAVLAAFLSLGLVACSEDEPPVRERASGATRVSLQTEDGLTLDGRLWVTHPERIAIYLHEYREDQSSWWSYARAPRNPAISAITFDFRGHGESEGEPDDIAGMLLDLDAAIHYARDSGYRHVVLVGAGMGGALAIVAAAGHPDISVVGFSVPSEFDAVTPVDASPHLGKRLALAASRDDLSAAYSIEEFQRVASLPPEQVAVYPGRAHGVEMLDGRAGANARAFLEERLAEFWRPRNTASTAP